MVFKTVRDIFFFLIICILIDPSTHELVFMTPLISLRSIFKSSSTLLSVKIIKHGEQENSYEILMKYKTCDGVEMSCGKAKSNKGCCKNENTEYDVTGLKKFMNVYTNTRGKRLIRKITRK